MDFVAIDVETANSDCSSICQIGIARFENGELKETWESYINPRDYFDPMNISIHGIDENSVQSAPFFENVYEKLKQSLENNIVIHHMGFDKTAISRAMKKHGLTEFKVKWLDSAKMVRRTWKEYSSKGYGLGNITKQLGIVFNHHDALEDAIAAGKVAVKAIEKSQLSLDDWLKRVKKPINL